MEMIKCSACGGEFDADHTGTEVDGQAFCADCRDEHAFLCPLCEIEELEERRGAIGSVLIVNDAEEAGVPMGLYEILKHPYYSQAMIGPAHIYEWAMRRIGDLPDGGIDTGTYPCGHVCRQCSVKLLADLDGKGK